MALILFVSSKHTLQASADSVITANNMTMVTAPGPSGNDLLYIIDNSQSVLMIYALPDPQNKKYIHPVASWNIPAMLESARQLTAIPPTTSSPGGTINQ